MKYIKFLLSFLFLILLLSNCGGNKEPETPISPEGPATGEPNMPMGFRAFTADPNGDNISYQFDWGDGSASPWTDFLPSGDTASLSRIYSAEGTYQVRVHAQDEKEKMSGWSEPHNITINHPDTSSPDTNTAPLTPNSPGGPIMGIPNIAQTYRASTTDPDGDELSYQFDWGDGTVSPWSDLIPSGDTITVNRIYWGNGTYEVRVQAQDGEEETSGWSEPLSLAVGYPDEIVDDFGSGIYPADIEVLPNGQRIYVTSFNDGTVRVIDGSNNSPMGDISVGTEPMGVTALPNSQYVYIMISGQNFVLALPTSGGTPDTIPVQSPFFATAHPSGEYVYVSSFFTGNVYVIQTSDNTLVDSINVGGAPYAIETLPNGEYIYVSASSNTSVIRTSDNTVVDSVSIGASDMAASPNGELLYECFNGRVYVLLTSNNTIIDTIQAGSYTWAGVCVHPSGQLLYVSDGTDDCVSVIYTPTNKVIEDIDVFDGPTFIDPLPNGEYIYVLNQDANVVGVLGYSE